MKRTLLGVLTVGLLTACAGIAAPAAANSESPKQSLQATQAAMAKAQSVQFDASGTLTLTLPQAVVSQLQAKAGSQGALLGSTTSVKFKISGAAKRPDQLDANLSATIGGLTINSELIATGGHLYYKNPMTQKWEMANRSTPAAHATSGASLYQMILNTATLLTEVTANPSNLDGVSVDEYHVVPNLAKLFTQLENGKAPKNPQALSAIQQLLQNASVTADVWTGTSDHLVRRATYDANVTADLSQLASAIGSLAPSGASAFTIPAGSTAHLTALVELNLHNYNQALTVTAPTIAP